jgi:hypothetical protein
MDFITKWLIDVYAWSYCRATYCRMCYPRRLRHPACSQKTAELYYRLYIWTAMSIRFCSIIFIAWFRLMHLFASNSPQRMTPPLKSLSRAKYASKFQNPSNTYWWAKNATHSSLALPRTGYYRLVYYFDYFSTFIINKYNWSAFWHSLHYMLRY